MSSKALTSDQFEWYQRRHHCGTAPIKGILKKSRERFPEAPNFIREGVAPIKLAPLDEQNIPREARWTKIDRRLVSTAALDKGNERYEAVCPLRFYTGIC